MCMQNRIVGFRQMPRLIKVEPYEHDSTSVENESTGSKTKKGDETSDSKSKMKVVFVE